LVPSPRCGRRDRCCARQDPGRHVRRVRAVRQHDPEGAPSCHPVRGAVRELQEHGARTAVTAWRRASLVAALAAVLVVVDQLTKTWALRTLTTRDIDLFWTLRFHLARNNGAAFSVGLGSGGLIGLLAIGVVIVLVALGRNLDSRLGVVSLGLVLGGALGNLADRMFR